MNTSSISQYTINIPQQDVKFFHTIVRKMGWKSRLNRQTATDDEPNDTTLRAIKDVEAGKTFKAASTEDLIKQILG